MQVRPIQFTRFRPEAVGLFVAVALTNLGRADDWPQWRGPQRDGVWRETGVVQTLPRELKYRWRTPLGGGYAGPAVAGNRVYVCDRVLPAGVENPESAWNKTTPVSGSERVQCLDAETGRVLWKHEYACRYAISYPAGPRATPAVDAGKVYTVGAMGHVFCLDAQTGAVIWAKSYADDFGAPLNTWGMAAAPLVDGKQVILLAGGKHGACVVALNKDTGAEIWRALDASDPGYSSPVIIQAAGQRQLIVWNPLGLHGLDPATGKVLWEQLFEARMGHSIATPLFDPQRQWLFVSSFFNGPTMLQLDDKAPTARVLWKGQSDSELPERTDGVHCLMSTPVFQDGYLYGVCGYGQLRCLDGQTGRRVWETLQATGLGRWWNAFLIKHEDRYFICNEQGELILAKLSPQGYQELGRVRLLEPTNLAGRRPVVWSHPAFAHRAAFARNDKELVCADLAEKR